MDILARITCPHCRSELLARLTPHPQVGVLVESRVSASQILSGFLTGNDPGDENQLNALIREFNPIDENHNGK